MQAASHVYEHQDIWSECVCPLLTRKAASPLMRKGAQSLPTASSQETHPSPSLLDYAPHESSDPCIHSCSHSSGCARRNPRELRRAWSGVETLQISGGQPQKKIPECGAETPMKRSGQPVEMSPLYVLLASQESSYVTGEVYGATGGLEVS